MQVIMNLHRFFCFLNAFLGKIVEWFPVAFSMVWNSEFSFSKMCCYLSLESTKSIARERRDGLMIDVFSFTKGICAKINATDWTGMWTNSAREWLQLVSFRMEIYTKKPTKKKTKQTTKLFSFTDMQRERVNDCE